MRVTMQVDSVLVLLTVGFLIPGTLQDDFYYGTFPETFVWSAASSSYQIEGGWDSDGKGENIWDRFSHVGGKVANNDTGDIACDSYNNYQEDVRLLKALGVQTYRFSLSWARILPDGTSSNVNEAGVDYYNKLIDALLAENITPMITLYHWDLPQALQDIGGWRNEKLIEYFTEYARICFTRFGDRVKQWLTFNEPYVFTWMGYGIGVFAPGGQDPAEGQYITVHTVLKAHAEAWHLYDKTFRPSQHGRCAITVVGHWKEPLDTKPENIQAAVRAQEFALGWIANPIFGTGDYSEVMKQQVYKKSMAQGYNKSRLPEFTHTEVARIKGTSDFFGLNHYTTQLVQDKVNGPEVEASYLTDQDTLETYDPSWPTSGSFWLRVVPWGLKKTLKLIKDNYGNPEIYITESGISDRNATLDDQHRIYYYQNYINEMLKAIDLDGVNVIGYTAWSLMDNFEWASGYDEKFGLHYVNFSDPERPRTPKASAIWYSQMIKDNGFFTDPDLSRAITGSGQSVAMVTLVAREMFAWIRGSSTVPGSTGNATSIFPTTSRAAIEPQRPDCKLEEVTKDDPEEMVSALFRRQDEEKLLLNVRGTEYAVDIKSLERAPQSTLALIGRKWMDSDTKRKPIFINRKPAIVECLLDFYENGELHIPDGLCAPLVIKEMEFWGLGGELIMPCCLRKLKGKGCTLKLITCIHHYLSQRRSYLEKCREGWRGRLWAGLEYPESSTGAKVFAWFMFGILATWIIGMCLHSMASFQLYEDDFGEKGTQRQSPDGDKNNKTQMTTILLPMKYQQVMDGTLLLAVTLVTLLRLTVAPNKRDYFKRPINVLEVIAVLFQLFFVYTVNYNPAWVYEYPIPFGIIMVLPAVPMVRSVLHMRDLRVMLYALKQSRNELGLLFLMILLGSITLGLLVYTIEMGSENSQFDNILEGVWWGVITFTTVGYGDVVPGTLFGRIVGAIGAIFGILIIALPVPIIAGNFSTFREVVSTAEAHIRMVDDRKRCGKGQTSVTYKGWANDNLDC